MKALVYTEYGSPEVLRLEEVEKPQPKAHEVLIKLAATSINLSDWETLIGKPLYARIGGLRKPAVPILGSDIAGTIEAVGQQVTRFKPGDRVFGDNLFSKGGFAEYLCCDPKILMQIPDGMSEEVAAALPQAVAIAYKGICVTGAVEAGQKILINGAGGGSGTFAIQLAKLAGADVTGVDNGGKLDYMRALGADHVIDYRKQDFTRLGQQFDFILDFVGYRSLRDYYRALVPGGACYLVGGKIGPVLKAAFVGPMLKRVTHKKIGLLFVDQPDHTAIEAILKLIAAGKIDPVIAKTFPLEEAAEALRFHGEGEGLGKVIVKIG